MNLWNRLRSVLQFGSITQVDDSGNTQLLQVQFGYLMLHDKLIHVQHYGFASNPPVKSDAIAIFCAGDRANGLAIGTNHQDLRPKNQKPGESQVYGPNKSSLAFTQDGVVLDCGGKTLVVQNCSGITITAPTVFVKGDLVVSGEVMKGYGGPDLVTLGQHRHTGTDSHGDSFLTNAPLAGT